MPKIHYLNWHVSYCMKYFYISRRKWVMYRKIKRKIIDDLEARNLPNFESIANKFFELKKMIQVFLFFHFRIQILL